MAPVGRDAELIASFLAKSGLESRVAERFIESFTAVERDVMGMLLIAEEALTPYAILHLGELVDTQPDWSDLPILVLTRGGEETAQSVERQQARLPLRHFSLLERPVRPSTLLSAVQAAVRARGRQFQIRDTVAQRDAATRALRQSEERMRIATEAAHIGTWELDLPTMELLASDTCKRNFGRLPDQRLSYEDLQISIHVEDRASVMEAVQAAITQHILYKAEYRIRWPDGSLHWILASGRVQYSADDTPLRIIGITLDVTERHLTMNALLINEKLAAVGRLSAAIAHEINNPLESVTNLVYLAQNSAVDPKAKEYLEVADRELRRVSSIASQTLRFYRQQSAPKDVTPRELFENVLSIQQGRLVNSNICVESRERSNRPLRCFDGEIRQVLNNLITNAIDAMHAGGRLLLRSRLATDRTTARSGMVITVADTGPGITATQLKQIFDPFFTTKGIGGTGLGLWVTQEIVTRHHGRLSVRSCTKPQRSGTVFTLFLPLTPGDLLVTR